MSKQAPRRAHIARRAAFEGRRRRSQELPAALMLAVLEVIENELAQETPGALYAERLARDALRHIRSRA